MELSKPPDIFSRDPEWSELSTFATSESLGATLAVLYGRRRQGKTLLLEDLVEAVDGFMFTGLEQSSTQNLAAMSNAYASFTGISAPVSFTDWIQVVDALLALGEGEQPKLVVIDELPYILRTAPELNSVLQNALSPRGRARQHSRTRLVLCGSAFSVMRNLLSGAAALRGRAVREMVVRPFDYREAAAFWHVGHDLELALTLNALVGGTPAYRDFCDGDEPQSTAELSGWVTRNLLNPSSSFFREGRVLLAEEPDIAELSLYFSVLSAIASGKTRRGQIAAALGRKETALAHPLAVLEETQLVVNVKDALRANRGTFKIAEPMLRFHQSVIVPNEPRLRRRFGAVIWHEIADTVSANIYGPHFEDVARQWTLEFADEITLGGRASRVAPTTVGCKQHQIEHELDIVAVERVPNQPDHLLAIGEAKWTSEPIGIAQLERLRHIRDLLAHGADSTVRLLLFSRLGFSKGLRDEASRSNDVVLVDLERLYLGE